MSGDLGYDGYAVTLNYFTGLPNPNAIGDANTAVLFKSLLKKDSVTKEKTLVELLEALAPTTAYTDELTIISWVQLYPKLAIDNSRMVRMLAHQIQARFLQIVGGKAYAKYLKCSIGSWIHGLFDCDRQVAQAAYKLFLLSFQNDREKIDRIWFVYYDQIVNFIVCAVLFESPDTLSDKRYTKELDSSSKYERVIAGCVMMLNKIVQFFTDSSIDSSDSKTISTTKSPDSLVPILTCEKLWDLLGPAANEKTINIPLFKTLLVLISALFASSEPFVARTSDAKAIHKLISKKILKLVRLKGNSNSINLGLVYSNVIVSFWDTLTVLTAYKSKKNFWYYGGSKSYSRLLEYLKLGYCNLNPDYYVAILKFFETLAAAKVSLDDEFLDFSNPSHAKAIVLKGLCKQLRGLRSNEEKIACVQCAYKVLSLFEKKDGLLQTLVYTAIDVFAKPRLRLPEEIGFEVEGLIFDALNDSIVKLVQNEAATSKEEGTKNTSFRSGGVDFESMPQSVVKVYVQLLKNLKLSDTAKDLGKRVINTIEEDSSLEKPQLAFALISSYFTVFEPHDEELETFVEVLPSYLQSDFVVPVTDVFCAYALANPSVDLSQTVDDFYVGLEEKLPSAIPGFLLAVPTLDLLKLSDVSKYIVDLAAKDNRLSEQSALVFRFKDNEEVSAKLIASSSRSEEGSLDYISSADLSNAEKSPHILQILTVAWKNSSKKECGNFLAAINSKQLLIDSFFEYLRGSNLTTKFASSATVAKERGILEDVISKISVEEVRNTDLAISNTLDQNAVLVATNGKDSTMENADIIFTYGALVRDLLDIQTDDVSLLTLASFISSYIDDYLFLKGGKRISSDENLLELGLTLRTLFLDNLEVSLDSVVAILNDELEDSGILARLVDQVKTNKLAYLARALKHVFTKVLDEVSLAQFDAAAFNFTKLAKSPALLGVFLSSSTRFFTKSTKFERVRNFVAAEILGARRSSDIMTTGLTWLTLAINFFDAEGEQYEVVPPHRLAMVINQISGWLESDIAYDESFIAMRVQVARFLSGVITTEPNPPDKTWSLAAQLASDNLGYCAVELDRMDLRYFTLRLIGVMCRSSTEGHPAEIWSSERTGIAQELMDLMVDENVIAHDSGSSSHAVVLTMDLMGRVFSLVNPPLSVMQSHAGSLYQLLGPKNFDSAKRTAVSALQKAIFASQQDFVVEYQLQKEDKVSARLPELLVKNVNIVAPPIEKTPEAGVSTYLWSWLLVFAHFEDITFAIRAEYMAQLGEFGAIDELLHYIFEQVEVNDSKFTTHLTSSGKTDKVSVEDNRIQDYDVHAGFETPEFEMKFLAVHLYYLSCRHLGPAVQRWYKELRDIQLKQRIEKFLVKFVLLLLISKLLGEVTSQKAKVEDKDENLTIKVNTVTNEIKSTYIIDEQTMEMVIKVPFVFPLDNVSVEGPLRLGVKEHQWKAWLLASQRVISLANGSIMDAIEVFNKNVNLHFSGFEECAICYSILHQDLSLPSKECPTCHNKFHAACLYKWFKSSGSSTCPMCRSAFNFRKS